MQISIIILSYNTKELLRKCLDSIYKELPNTSFEIIVLDNASNDGSVEMVRKEYRDIHVVESETNLGFGKGVNKAAGHAKGEFLFLLNSDAVLKDNHILHIVEKMKQEATVGIIGGQLLNADGTLQRSSAHFYTLSYVLRMLVLGDKGDQGDDGEKMSNVKCQMSNVKSVDWVSGGYMVIRRSVFEEIGGFDERFFMYVEDMELCYRVKKMGYNIYTCPTAKAEHSNHGSSNRTFAIEHIYRGLYYFYKKHRSPWELAVLWVLLRAKAVLLLGFGTITGNRYLTTTYKRALHL